LSPTLEHSDSKKKTEEVKGKNPPVSVQTLVRRRGGRGGQMGKDGSGESRCYKSFGNAWRGNCYRAERGTTKFVKLKQVKLKELQIYTWACRI